MKRLALPIADGRIAPTLDEAKVFRLWDTEGEKLLDSRDVEINENSVGILRSLGVEALVCGMLSPALRRDLAMAGIVVFAGIYGPAEETVQQLLNGSLACEPDTMRSAHGAHYSPCAHSGEY